MIDFVASRATLASGVAATLCFLGNGEARFVAVAGAVVKAGGHPAAFGSESLAVAGPLSSVTPPHPLAVILIMRQPLVVPYIKARRNNTSGITLIMSNIAKRCGKPWQCAMRMGSQCALRALRGPLRASTPGKPVTMLVTLIATRTRTRGSRKWPVMPFPPIVPSKPITPSSIVAPGISSK